MTKVPLSPPSRSKYAMTRTEIASLSRNPHLMMGTELPPQVIVTLPEPYTSSEITSQPSTTWPGLPGLPLRYANSQSLSLFPFYIKPKNVSHPLKSRFWTSFVCYSEWSYFSLCHLLYWCYEMHGQAWSFGTLRAVTFALKLQWYIPNAVSWSLL